MMAQLINETIARMEEGVVVAVVDITAPEKEKPNMRLPSEDHITTAAIHDHCA